MYATVVMKILLKQAALEIDLNFCRTLNIQNFKIEG